MACPNMRAALRMLTARQIRGHLARDLGIDSVPDTKAAATNTAIRLASQNPDRLRFQWGILGKKLSLAQLHGLTEGCPKNKRAALEWLIEKDAVACQVSTTGRNRGQNPAAAALASQTQRQKKHFVKARKLLAKRLKRCGPQAVTPAPLPTQPAQPAGELPSQLPAHVELDIHAQIKTAVKTVLQLDGLGQTLTEVRRQVSSLLGVDCANGAHMARVDHCANKYLT